MEGLMIRGWLVISALYLEKIPPHFPSSANENVLNMEAKI